MIINYILLVFSFIMIMGIKYKYTIQIVHFCFVAPYAFVEHAVSVSRVVDGNYQNYDRYENFKSRIAISIDIEVRDLHAHTHII
jgi:hypothetical protein